MRRHPESSQLGCVTILMIAITIRLATPSRIASATQSATPTPTKSATPVCTFRPNITPLWVQYAQVMNDGMAVFTKASGDLAYGPAPLHTLFKGFESGQSGLACESNVRGDPVVFFDHLARRWIWSYLADPALAGFSAHQCIAVSDSDDALGKYTRYEYKTRVEFPDYPKFGLWPTAYYYTTEFAGLTQVCAFDRTALLAGDNAHLQCCTFANQVPRRLLPATLVGTAVPPVDAPNPMISLCPHYRVGPAQLLVTT